MVKQSRGTIDPVNVEELEIAAAAGRPDAGSRKLLKAELDYIRARRDTASEKNLVGLALSGGGIRSASFALGVMQALAGKDLLSRVDYLSTVSGGGYIGSALTWLLNKEHKDEDDKIWVFGLDKKTFPYADESRPANTAEWRMLRFLRSHGNYLTPGDGITLASGLAVVFRGVILNLLVALPIAVVLFWCVLNIGGGSTVGGVENGADAASLWTQLGKTLGFGTNRVVFGSSLLLAGIAVAVFVLLSIGYSLSTFFSFLLSGPVGRYKARRFVESKIRWLLWIILLTLAFGAIPWIVDTAVAPAVPDCNASQTPACGTASTGNDSCTELLYGIVTFIAGLIGGAFTFLQSRKAPPVLLATVGAALLLAGFVLIAYGLADCIDNIPGGWREKAMWVALLIAVVTGIFVNVNYITLHRFYRDRLMETFMPDIDTALKNGIGSASGATVAYLQDLFDACHTAAPYHIVNTNVILVDSGDPRRRIRGGDSFILSPCYCGSAATGWVATKDFLDGKLSLATAMAISGAAANPNTGAGGSGATRSRVVSLVMTLLNVRLGYWVTNPNSPTPRPWARNHFVVATQQILQGHREDWPLVELSDGGHFDNLGLFELVRRKARIIILSDGAADPCFEFSDLRTAMRRVQEDFGAQVKFDQGDLEKLLLEPRDPNDPHYPKTADLAETGFAVADITYADGSPGKLYYVKSTLTRNTEPLLKAYKAAFPDYPDETTADQFFSEDQFEAYRELGRALGNEMLKDSGLDAALAAL